MDNKNDGKTFFNEKTLEINGIKINKSLFDDISLKESNKLITVREAKKSLSGLYWDGKGYKVAFKMQVIPETALYAAYLILKQKIEKDKRFFGIEKHEFCYALNYVKNVWFAEYLKKSSEINNNENSENSGLNSNIFNPKIISKEEEFDIWKHKSKENFFKLINFPLIQEEEKNKNWLFSLFSLLLKKSNKLEESTKQKIKSGNLCRKFLNINISDNILATYTKDTNIYLEDSGGIFTWDRLKNNFNGVIIENGKIIKTGEDVYNMFIERVMELLKKRWEVTIEHLYKFVLKKDAKELFYKDRLNFDIYLNKNFFKGRINLYPMFDFDDSLKEVEWVSPKELLSINKLSLNPQIFTENVLNLIKDVEDNKITKVLTNIIDSILYFTLDVKYVTFYKNLLNDKSNIVEKFEFKLEIKNRDRYDVVRKYNLYTILKTEEWYYYKYLNSDLSDGIEDLIWKHYSDYKNISEEDFDKEFNIKGHLVWPFKNEQEVIIDRSKNNSASKSVLEKLVKLSSLWYKDYSWRENDLLDY